MTQERLGEVFDSVAETYDEVRLGYPESLVDAALARGCLQRGSRVLEIGCGTGKLTELLVARQLDVNAVDPGPNMIERAKRRVGGNADVHFRLGRFEELALPKGAFDAVFAATSFHWLDPDVSWTKTAACLQPNGLLALLAHRGIRDERSAEAEDEFLALLHEYAPDVADDFPPSRDLDTIMDGARARSGNASEVWDWVMQAGRRRLARPVVAELFDEVELSVHLSELEQSADELIAHLRTTSLYFQLDPVRRRAFEEDDRRLVERHGGSLTFMSAIFLMTARRRPAR